MTEKELNKEKKRIVQQAKILRKDGEAILKMADYVSKNIDNLTIDNAEEWNEPLRKLEDKLQIAELFG